ncbi:hypothetical protein D1Y84_17495 [Acidipila sp. EB88]|nr:hypothetical protein D1Y84_17495 [Acidipila sp. EB88]
MAPYNAARAQPNDLTDADTLALGVGVAHAAHDCVATTVDPQAFAGNPVELLALGRLCILGQQFEPARATLVRYLALPEPPEREVALLLLVRSLLGMKDPGAANAQAQSLLRDYPYDAQIHYAIDSVIDASEEVNDELNRTALQLCAQQGKNTLPLLLQGKALSAATGSASASMLYADALRCAALDQASGDLAANGPQQLRTLHAILEVPAWQHSAELSPMEEAFARFVMTAVPLPTLQAQAVSATGLAPPRPLPLGQRTVTLVPFTLWAPSTISVLQTLVASAPQQTVYAITSWRANTGGADTPSREMLNSLEALQAALPAKVKVLVVPDVEFQSFHADAYPGGIVVREGRVVFNAVLAGDGAMRMLLRTLPAATASTGGQLSSTHRAK